MRCRLQPILGAVCLLSLSGFVTAEEPLPEKVEFSKHIRPILSANCFACHGPDEEARQAELRLDLKDEAFADLGGYFALVAGNPEKSHLYSRIMTEDASEVMPPLKTGKKLTRHEKALIRKWIEQGAGWQGHWAFIAPQRPELPAVQHQDWVRNPIDQFILSTLEVEGLKPSPEADRRTLIRRVTLDLTGLPPTPEEVEAFVNDSSPDAYEKVVDRLLQTVAYGEHMARIWLDAVRYGDTHGLHLDNYREMWAYREWVINAYNRNLPFDQFTIEQIAGDLLQNATLEQQIASGYNRCHVTTSEGGSIAEEVHVRNVVDQVATTSTVWMGLTIGCAQCHDHRFDPITQKEFYQLFAYFNSMDGSPLDGNAKDHAPVARVMLPEDRQQMETLTAEIQALTAKLQENSPEVMQAQAEWEAKVQAELGASPINYSAWHMVGPFQGGDLFATAYDPEKNSALDQAYGKLKWAERKDFEDGKVHIFGEVGYSVMYFRRTIAVKDAKSLTVSLGSDDGIKLWLNGKEVLANNASRGALPDQESVTLSLNAGENVLLMKIINGVGATAFYFKASDSGYPANITTILTTAADQRTPQQQQELTNWFRRNVDPTTKPLVEQIAQLEAQQKQINDRAATTLVMKEMANPKPAYILKRGDYDKPGDQVERKTPASLPPMTSEMPNNRLGFAQWLLSADHPLTSRVAVNGYWQKYFGKGLVKTQEDFGNQGSRPTHPELLDWLSVEFRETGWDVKRMQKLLVMSATYRQSSVVTPELLEKDPTNRLLARGPRFRLDAEMIRDQALSASGLLVRKLGGPSVKPPQPGDLWFAVAYTTSNTAHFSQDVGEKTYRRSVYTFWKRTSPPPQMSILDAPSREACTVRRERTNTPLQALMLLNEQQYFECARQLAARMIKEGGATPEEKLAFGYLTLTAKEPSEQARQELLALNQDALTAFQADPESAQKVITVGDTKPDPQLNPAELAAWTLVGNLLLNLDEVLTKE